MDIVNLPVAPPSTIAPDAQPTPPSASAKTSFKDVLARLGERMDSGEASVQGVMQAAPKMGPAGQLLALQAGVYQYTETFEVAAKMVDKGTNAIKTTLQGQ